MMTVRQMERLWSGQAYGRLFRELIAARPEAAVVLPIDSGWEMPAAALVLIRLDELSQPHVPLYGRLLREILAAQQADGGWGDLTTTALCVRALLCDRGQGWAIERGLAYLSNLQKNEGLWPRIPLRRMSEDPLVSAFILYQLADSRQFREAVRSGDAVHWFVAHEASLDSDARYLWDCASLRCRMHEAMEPAGMLR